MTETRRTKFIRHILRHNKFVVNIMEGKIINDKRKRVRLKDINLGNITKTLSLSSYKTMKRLVGKREKCLQQQAFKYKKNVPCTILIWWLVSLIVPIIY